MIGVVDAVKAVAAMVLVALAIWSITIWAATIWAATIRAATIRAAAAGETIPAPGTVMRDCAVCPELVVVPAGLFIMGSPPSEIGHQPDEAPQRRVRIDRPFAIGRTEVTFAQWQACLHDGGCDGYRPSDHGWGRGDRPVMNVSLDDVRGYLDWLSARTGHRYRLPSEAEWEYAARARTTTAYPWGDRIGTGRANCYECGSDWGGESTAPVARFPANGFGLFDMHGNVWEWTADCRHDGYAGAPETAEPWSDAGDGNCRQRVQRGGSWYYVAMNSRSARRSYNRTEARWYDVGFRVVRDLP